ncbi:MAG: protein kinase [Actinomycetota bacterium]|nr:protein kinase [Actinomycetota bacterium]
MVGPGDEVAGRYRIERNAATGALGILTIGHDPVMDAPVLLLLCRGRVEADAFERNMRAVGALTHPGIARVVDQGDENDVPFAVIEMSDTATLDQILDRDGALEARPAIRIGMQVAQALEHAHAAGVVHGSLVSSAVLVGEGDRAKVAGFGLSRGGDPTIDVRAAGKLLDEMLGSERAAQLDELVDRAVGRTTPFATASEMRRALEDVRVRISPVEEDGDHEDEPDTTVWPIPGARYDPARLGRRVIAAMIAVAFVAGAAFLWRVMTRADELREERERNPTPSVTTSAETVGLA